MKPTTPPTHFVPEGDKPKLERSRDFFRELRASLKTGLDVERDARAENERLREALEQIAYDFDGDEFQDSADACDQHREIARAALEDPAGAKRAGTQRRPG